MNGNAAVPLSRRFHPLDCFPPVGLLSERSVFDGPKLLCAGDMKDTSALVSCKTIGTSAKLMWTKQVLCFLPVLLVVLFSALLMLLWTLGSLLSSLSHTEGLHSVHAEDTTQTMSSFSFVPIQSVHSITGVNEDLFALEHPHPRLLPRRHGEYSKQHVPYLSSRPWLCNEASRR